MHAKEGLLQVGDSLFNLGLAGRPIIAAITNKVNAASADDRVTDPLKSVFSSCGFCQSMRVGPPSHNFWPVEEEGAKQKLVDI